MNVKVDGTLTAESLLAIPASASQWMKMDDFEGKIYRRECVTVTANVYIWADEMAKLNENEQWSFSYFEKNRLQDWILA